MAGPLFRTLQAVRHPDDPVQEGIGIGLGRRLLFQQVPEPKTVKNQPHLGDPKATSSAASNEVVRNDQPGTSGTGHALGAEHDVDALAVVGTSDRPDLVLARPDQVPCAPASGSPVPGGV